MASALTTERIRNKYLVSQLISQKARKETAMILKVRTNVDNNLCPKESWRFYDGVEGLHYSIYPSESTFFEESKNWGVPSDVQTIELCELKPVDGEILFAAFNSAATGPVHLFCNTTCYLLNDNGRTIEKLI